MNNNTEEQISYYQQKLLYEIDSSDLNQLISNEENIIIIDARSKESFEKEHIPGAINIPHRSLLVENTSDLNREALYITYCDGIGCNASTKGALNMVKLGFRAKELIGGIDWWKRDGYKTEGNHSNGGDKINCGC
jgi:rhodanese-related sulfurtransferase